HGQQNPRPDFADMDDSGWFIEGLAVLVSGQLERSHRTAAREALQAVKAPTRLADAWSGRYRYGVSGSMVEFVDNRYGRDAIKKLLKVVSNEDAMKLLKTTEREFLEAWKEHVRTQANAYRADQEYESSEVMVPMRDGLRLHTVLIRPRGAGPSLPILL